jgi:hypothetical protein
VAMTYFLSVGAWGQKAPATPNVPVGSPRRTASGALRRLLSPLMKRR